MRVRIRQTFIFELFAMGLLLLLCACDKKCQQPAAQPFSSITGQQWRLVDTTDPAFKPLNNTTFPIFQFNVDYSGSVTQVDNNREKQNPSVVFQYNVDPGSSTIVASFQTPPPPQNTQQSTQSTPQSSLGTAEYSYNLGTELDMTDTQRGYNYHFVPFQGIVQPDEQCSF